MKVSDCQSTDRTSISRILSRGTLALAISARSKFPAAADIAIFSMIPPPDRRAPARLSLDAGPALCADRRRNADRQPLLGRIGSELRHSGGEILELIPLQHRGSRAI